MRGRGESFLEGLGDLEAFDAGDRRGVFRQSIAALARAAADGLGPLDRLSPEGLAKSVRIGLAEGLFDDFTWLAPAAAATALYDIAAALPLGPERREIGRRVLAQLYEGPAEAFAALAMRMAASPTRALSGAGIRARLRLCLCLPSTMSVPTDTLALALVTRRELASDWLAPSAGSLPERRFTARLLERAAREAGARAREGDLDAVRAFRSAALGPGRGRPETLDGAFGRLLADRETLVWRHVASARGLLAHVVPEIPTAIDAALAPELSPTEWRRAAASLVASIAVRPDEAMARAVKLLESPLIGQDPGVATAMVWGIPRAYEVEPEACEELLERITRAAPMFVAESLVDLRAEFDGVGERAARISAAAIAQSLRDVSADEEDVTALARVILRDLDRAMGDGSELHRAIRAALGSFAEVGTRDAFARANKALGIASQMVSSLEAVGFDRAGAPLPGRLGPAATLLRELDRNLLESEVMQSLMQLGRAASHVGTGVGALDDLDERLARWLLEAESVPRAENDTSRIPLHHRQLRALLHLIDGETSEFDDDPERRARVHQRWAETCHVLLGRLAREQRSPFRRSMAATIARALDARVRDGAADAADVMLHAADRVEASSDMDVLAEASMHPDVSEVLRAYARYHRAIASAGDDAAAALSALDALVGDLPSGSTQRLESLKTTLARLWRALAAVASTAELRPLGDLEGSPLVGFDDALARLAQLTESAHRRCGDHRQADARGEAGAYPLALAAGRALQPGADAYVELEPSVAAAIEGAERSVPGAFARLCAIILPWIGALAAQESERKPSRNRTDAPISFHAARIADEPTDRITIAPTSIAPVSVGSDGRLPAWIPPKRTLGGFYVQRQLGRGGAGTVFVVTRAEERHDPAAERFALKVPDYDANAARSLSETDFLKLFRQEASALLAVPEHPNVASFVTFDAGARPKPILVMELVEGTACNQLIDGGSLTVARALDLINGVLAGLASMHSVGVGHLDLKPSNVIVRGNGAPVLVDFGLAGRHIRPGCGTSSYVAPEVWSSVALDPSPLPADVYAIACLAFELVTGTTLFEAPNEVALVASHLAHDGAPERLKQFAKDDPAAAPLVALLTHCIRRAPADRASLAATRAGLADLPPALRQRRWPLGRFAFS